MIKFIRRGTILSFLFSFSALVSAQTNYQVSVMSWNLLNFPDQSALAADTTDRCPAYRSVMQYAQPDILVTVENTSANGASIILSNVMNTYGKHYAEGTFINGYDTDNAIYYRDSIFQFISNVPISTPLRDISHFTLKFIPTGDTLHIFAAHLKAGLGYESDRAVEVTLLRQVTDAFPAGTNFLAAGDFNIYTTTEPCYQDFLYNSGTNEGYFLDPISVTGTYNNSAYSNYHTQSTRLTSIGTAAFVPLLTD